MGCDIHIVVEFKHPDLDHWFGVHACPYISGYRDTVFWDIEKRNYGLFGALTCGQVRGPADPDFPLITGLRGLPDDVSDLATYFLSNGHSPSWLTLREAVEVFGKYTFNLVKQKILGKNTKWAEMYPLAAAGRWFGLSLGDGNGGDDEPPQYNIDNYRIVFDFDS